VSSQFEKFDRLHSQYQVKVGISKQQKGGGGGGANSKLPPSIPDKKLDNTLKVYLGLMT
jgi:hypothetical protein